EEGYDPYAPFVLSTPHMAPDWEAIDEALAPQQPLTKNPNIDARIPHIPKSPRRDIPKMPFRDTYPRRDIPKMPFRDTYPSIDIRKRPGYDTNPLTDRF
ncbi:MAG: hypothetical protein KC444_02815, partial [Nitrosopumilus sp.]|nr:hypothetical protein [Nitrosopumilus sp.]